MYEITLFEFFLFLSLFTIERIIPARKFPIFQHWFKHWLLLLSFATLWLSGLIAVWVFIPGLTTPLQALSFWPQVLVAYFIYTFIAYWYHRLRHTVPCLWRYVHYMHHSPAHMDTRVTFWRHPVEMILDSIVILAVGKLIGVSAEVIFCVLVIESMLETFHHSNIKTPKKLRWIGYVIQLPEQHLIHHQYGLHRWNYGTLTLWDSLFLTVKVPTEWQGKLGVREWNNTKRLLFYKY